MATESSLALPLVVLDTNAVLDLWVFGDAGMQPLFLALQAGLLQWLVCPAMRVELARTLGYRSLSRYKVDTARVLGCFDQWSTSASPPPVTLVPSLRCSDPDDQVFLDLALASKAKWLVTHDRALIRLTRPARGQGLHVVRPRDWRLEQHAVAQKVNELS